ncbi:MmcB family DNA repair protein [Sphingomonas sp. ID0503]|uniref:MmcB family DNA repair protein n=1 Tax=Sphingomonas sp. ID0503 TaxID=3399691 RepID=UPI003AFAA724
MASASIQPCFDDAPAGALAVARGVTRLFFRHDWMAICEVPLGNNRRADIMAIGPDGCITIVEIKVARGDLLGDRKWRDYLDYCDRFYWAVPTGFDASPLHGTDFAPDIAGLIVADRYDAEIVREAAKTPLAAPRRKAETLRFARRAARRVLGALDPSLEGLD